MFWPGPVHEPVAQGFLMALRQEYVYGQPGAQHGSELGDLLRDCSGEAEKGKQVAPKGVVQWQEAYFN